MEQRERFLRDINAASRLVIRALRLNRRLESLRASHQDESAIPTPTEYREDVAALATDYRVAVARYRSAVERVIPCKTKALGRLPKRTHHGGQVIGRLRRH